MRPSCSCCQRIKGGLCVAWPERSISLAAAAQTSPLLPIFPSILLSPSLPSDSEAVAQWQPACVESLCDRSQNRRRDRGVSCWRRSLDLERHPVVQGGRRSQPAAESRLQGEGHCSSLSRGAEWPQRRRRYYANYGMPEIQNTRRCLPSTKHLQRTVSEPRLNARERQAKKKI